jgi:hypothetical protein
MVEHSEYVGVVQSARPLLPARHLPHQASRVHDGPVYYWTRNVAEQAYSELDQPQSHRFISGVDATQNQQHRPHF